MRYFEIIRPSKISVPEVKLAKITVPKSPEELEREAGKRNKAVATIAKAHARTRDAADRYNKRMAADDDAERKQQRLIAKL